MLLVHWMRLAASRTFCTAGSNRPIRIPMIAITTSSSIRVNPRRAAWGKFIRLSFRTKRIKIELLQPIVIWGHLSMLFSRGLFLALGVAILAAGCGSKKIYPVQGKIVDSDGNPIAGLKGGAVEAEAVDA